MHLPTISELRWVVDNFNGVHVCWASEWGRIQANPLGFGPWFKSSDPVRLSPVEIWQNRSWITSGCASAPTTSKLGAPDPIAKAGTGFVGYNSADDLSFDHLFIYLFWKFPNFSILTQYIYPRKTVPQQLSLEISEWFNLRKLSENVFYTHETSKNSPAALWCVRKELTSMKIVY